MAKSGKNSPLIWPDLLDLMQRCKPLSDCDPCTIIGHKIANSLVKIAAVRIFAEPEQSIVELLVNSLDAYEPESKIGKFGMGFFSNLYWLVGHPRRKLIIDVDLPYCRYIVNIQEIDGRLAFNLNTTESKQLIPTSTSVIIQAHNDKFSKEEVTAFKNQAEKLRFIKYPDLEITDITPQLYQYKKTLSKTTSDDLRQESEWIAAIAVQNSVKPKNIIYSIDYNEITVRDSATGIPLEVLLGNLLVPSISTKGLQLATTDKTFSNDSRLINTFITTEQQKNISDSFRKELEASKPNKQRLNKSSFQSSFVILVGGIVVYSTEKTYNMEGSSMRTEYILDMPRNTRLPVSRDDIILSASTTKIMKEGIEKLFKEASNTLLSNNISSLQRLLLDYIEYTPSTENKKVVKDSMDEFYEKNRDRLVPDQYLTLYQSLNLLYIPGPDDNKRSFNFIGSDIYDAWEIERVLDEHLKSEDNIWYGFNVVRLSNAQRDITNGGLIKYLFIKAEYINLLGKNWIDTISISYNANKLYSYRSAYGAKEYAKYDSPILFNLLELSTKVFKPILFREEVRNILVKLTEDIEKLRVLRTEMINGTAGPISQEYRDSFIKPSQIIKEPEILEYLFIVLSKMDKMLQIYFNNDNSNDWRELIYTINICLQTEIAKIP